MPQKKKKTERENCNILMEVQGYRTGKMTQMMTDLFLGDQSCVGFFTSESLPIVITLLQVICFICSVADSKNRRQMWGE